MNDHPNRPVSGPTKSSSVATSWFSTETVISLARDTWRLRKEMDRTKKLGVTVPEKLNDIADQLWDELEVAGVRFVDPKGQDHDSGALYKVAFIEGEGNASLWVAETLSPGVQIEGVLVAIPTVVLSRGVKS